MNITLHPRRHTRRHTRRRLAAGLAAIVLIGSACGSSSDDSAADAAGPDQTADVELYDSSLVHSIDVEFDADAYDELIETFETTGEKDWIEATVTIDGVTLEEVGLRLKGNSSLFGLTSETADAPEELPWLIRLDKFVDDQSYQGVADLVVRSNSSETAMNEAVALELLEATGLAAQQAISAAFTVNGSDPELRLVVEHPDKVWAESEFGDDDGLLYKADSEGDYTYRGDDPDAYDDVFDQKAGDDDLEPLIEFLDFINNSDDETFADELDDWLDVDAFATYLAFQDLVDNADDIDGRGNNSYLYFDTETERFTVVNWDLNLALGVTNLDHGGPAAPLGDRADGSVVPGERPADAPAGAPFEPPIGDGSGLAGERPDGELPEPPAGEVAGGRPGAGPDADNVLSDRFLGVDAFAELVTEATAELTDTLVSSGFGDDVVADWVELLSSDADDLVDPDTVESEADDVLASLKDER